MLNSRLTAAALAITFTAAAIAAEPVAIAPAMKPYADKLIEVAKTYENYARVDDEMRWAPTLCRMPMPGAAHFSISKDDDTHGRKLYSVFAKQRDAYFKVNQDAKERVESPVGQIIVKESWFPDEVKPGDKREPTRVKRLAPEGTPLDPFRVDHFKPYATRDGKTYKAARPAGLFVMMKFDPKTSDTDAGWVYCTVAADRKTVTAVGKIASCMECHQKTRHDRLFGMYSEGSAAKGR
jgi:hypothetical protein